MNQLGEFSAEIASKTYPLRSLLHPSLSYNWISDHEHAFKTTKLALTSPPIIGNFDLMAESVLQTDASCKNGFGYALLQRQSDRWRLIQCGSCFLTDTMQLRIPDSNASRNAWLPSYSPQFGTKTGKMKLK